MDKNSQRTDYSPTFREGKSGSWKSTFKKAHSLAFKEADTSNCLVELGYEVDKEWKSDLEIQLEKDTAEKEELDRQEKIEKMKEALPQLPDESPAEWFERIYQQQDNEKTTDYIERIHALDQEEPWE
jgi:hypothetical protein